MVNNHSLVLAQFYLPQLALVVKELFLQRMNRPVAVTNNGASFIGGVGDSHFLFCPEALLHENCQHASVINRETMDEIVELLLRPFSAFAVALSTPGSWMLIGVPTLVSVDCWGSESLRLAVRTELYVEVSSTDGDGPTTASRVLALAQASLAATSLALLSCILLLVLQ